MISVHEFLIGPKSDIKTKHLQKEDSQAEVKVKSEVPTKIKFQG